MPIPRPKGVLSRRVNDTNPIVPFVCLLLGGTVDTRQRQAAWACARLRVAVGGDRDAAWQCLTYACVRACGRAGVCACAPFEAVRPEAMLRLRCGIANRPVALSCSVEDRPPLRAPDAARSSPNLCV